MANRTRITEIDKTKDQVVSSTTITLLSTLSSKEGSLKDPQLALKFMRDYNIMIWNKDTTNDVNVWLETIRDPSGINDNADSYDTTGDQDEDIALDDTNSKIGQSFEGDDGFLRKVSFYLKKTGSPTGDMVAKIYAHTGTFGTDGTPTGTALATSRKVKAEDLTGTYQFIDFFFDDYGSNENRIQLTDTTKYFVTLEYDDGDASNYVQVGVDGSSPSADGNYALYTGSWADDNTKDVIFTLEETGVFDWYPVTASTGVGTASGSGLTTEAGLQQYTGSEPYFALRVRAVRASGDVTGVDGLFLMKEF